MADPFLAEIRLMSFVFPPKGWALCDGQLLPINQNQALFSLLGTTYGGDGRVNFGLPDLRARMPLHTSTGHVLGQRAGEAGHTVTPTEMPAHTHPLSASTVASGGVPAPAGRFLGAANDVYTAPTNLTSLSPQSVSAVGGSQPHENRQPFLALSFCIALVGIFPSQN
jgi:microcystin-dependent protein